MTAGVTSAGFTAKTVQEIVDELEQAELSTIDPALDLSPTEPLGQINGIFASKLAEVWELLAVAYNGFNPDAAEGFLLEALCALTGVKKEKQRKTLVLCTLNLAAGQSYVPGQLEAAIVGQDVHFVNKFAVTSTLAGNYPNIVFEATSYGPIAANAGTLNSIATPVSGWNSITNPANGVLGRFDETDTEVRARRKDELTAPGACTVDAIRADLLRVPAVLQALVFENTSLITDVNGVPGKAIECVIWDNGAAVDADVRAKIWASKPSGIETYGSITGTTTDSTGALQTVKFSRATAKPVFFEFDVVTDSTFDVTNGPAAIRTAAKAIGDKLKLGEDVYALRFRAAALSVAGVVDVTALRLGFTVSPVGTSNLVIAPREIATFSTGAMVVNVT